MHILRQRLLGEEWSSPGVEASGLDTLAGARYSTGGTGAATELPMPTESALDRARRRELVSIRSLALATRPAGIGARYAHRVGGSIRQREDQPCYSTCGAGATATYQVRLIQQAATNGAVFHVKHGMPLGHPDAASRDVRGLATRPAGPRRRRDD